MRKLITVVLLVLCASMAMAAGTVKVRIGVHANEGGIPLAAVAQDQGFFKKYGIEPVFTIVESGPTEMTAMRSDNRSLDIGYIGAGVAWNPIDGAGNSLSFVFLDGLSNSEMLLAKKGIFVDANKNKKFDDAEIYAGLKGQTVYIEVGTTPGGWFRTLVDLVNADKAEADKLWISCETSSYLAGYTAPNASAANKVTVVNTLNANLPAGMATSGGMAVVAGFSPATSTILKTNKDAEKIATTVGNFPAEKSFPSTWVASEKWLAENPVLAQNFVNALVEAAVWRSNNMDAAMRAGEQLCQKPANSFDPINLVAPEKDEYLAWFANKDALGYRYMKALYESKVPNVPKGNPVKPFEKAFNDKYLLEALKLLK
ncbi:MAG: ABC transporter substrate-binding protein [Spirochaetes bacterium]|nr:ABC transporter substrate-binding protein [Spirochaetota bacterium]